MGHGQVLIKLEAHPIACCLPVGRGLGNDRALLQRINRGKIDLKVTRTGGTRQGQPVVYLHDLANYLDSIADKAA
ncbi:hypothetical protein N015_17305 [Pseudomonas asturiensis]|uniref:Pyocin activator protein PrtN n=1 Tax=Pseudomonas asturiensis TaxID=1190415 RepID=A0ABX6HJP2_9PSED|nr:hypothetical protein N015_17305 [Pseudomonas asturiensis]